MVFEGNKCGLQNFVKKQKRFKKYDDVNASPLHHAAEEGQVELMEMIVNESSCEGNRTLQLVLCISSSQ